MKKQFAESVPINIFMKPEIKIAKPILTQRVRIASATHKVWHESIKAKVDDIIEFEISFTNCNSKSIDNLIVIGNIPKGLKLIEGSITTDGSRHLHVKFAESEKFTLLTIDVGTCEPATIIFIRYTAVVVRCDDLPDDRDSLYNWAQINIDSAGLTRIHTEIVLR